MDTEPKMWTCGKYGLKVLEANAAAFCARRYEQSIEGNKSIEFESCSNCERGAALYRGGKHESNEREVGMELIKRKCKTHGEYETKRTNGVCPQCKDVKKIVPAKTKEKAGALVAPHRTAHSTGLPAVTLDLEKYPKLRDRLIMVGLNSLLEELESKA